MKTEDADQASYLVEFQEGSCAVYAEIALTFVGIIQALLYWRAAFTKPMKSG